MIHEKRECLKCRFCNLFKTQISIIFNTISGMYLTFIKSEEILPNLRKTFEKR